MSTGWLLIGASAAAILWVLLGAVYRLYFHPLSKAPGPRLAALTFWFEVYYDLIRAAQFPWNIVKLHETYGPIVRISPNEVHISDVSYASTHFSNSIPLNRHIFYRDMFGMPAATFSTIEHDLHKLRSSALRNMFSKKRIFQLEPLITKKVDSCITRLNAFKSSGDVVYLRLLFTCLTTDIITEYNLARSYDLLSTTDLSPIWRTTFESALRNYHLFKHFPFLWPMVRAIPDRIITFLSPDFNLILGFERDNQNQARAAMDRSSEEKDYDHTIIFRELLNSDLPPAEKTHARLWQEAQSLVGAGTETTANTLGFIIFSLLSAPGKMARLTHELQELNPP